MLGNQEKRTEGINKGSFKLFNKCFEAQEFIEQVYSMGYQDGSEKQINADELIEQGRDEAWKLALHIFRLNQKERKSVFGYDRDTVDVLESMDASEAIEKIKAYEEKKQEKDEHIEIDKEKVMKLADEIGIHKLLSIAKEIRSE